MNNGNLLFRRASFIEKGLPLLFYMRYISYSLWKDPAEQGLIPGKLEHGSMKNQVGLAGGEMGKGGTQ